jgi:TRAP-type C4-dicarboxylate transport system permease small subunit
MGANIAGIYGAQIFRQDDSPLYRRGFGINIAVLAVGLALAIVRYVDDIIRRRRNRNQTILQAESASDEGQTTKEDEGALAGGQTEPETVQFDTPRKQ